MKPAAQTPSIRPLRPATPGHRAYFTARVKSLATRQRAWAKKATKAKP